MRTIFAIVLIAFAGHAHAQSTHSEIGNRILREAEELYRLERASWVSTDMVKKNFAMENVYGYFTYRSDSSVSTVFFSNKKEILYTLSYTGLANPGNVVVSGTKRPFTGLEKRLFKIRAKAEKQLLKNTEYFTQLENIRFNVVMHRQQNQVKVYLISGTSKEGIVPLGNDYLLTYSNKGKQISSERIHQNLIVIPTEPETEDSEQVVATMHTHAEQTSPYITPTDICTLLLFEDFVTWNVHIVFSENLVSYFNISERSLKIMTREEFNQLEY